MDKPFKIIKAFEKLEHAENFRKGNIVLHSVAYYQNIEGNRRNINEFQASFTKKSPHITYEFVNSALLLCFHHNSVTKSQYGKYKVQIQDPCDFFDQLTKRLGCLIFMQRFGAVIYGGDDPNEKIKFYCQQNYNCDSGRLAEMPAFHKENKDVGDKEARMFFLYNESSIQKCIDFNKEISIKFFKHLHDRKFEPKEILSFDEWKKSKSNSIDYGYDHWIKIELNNIKFDSERLYSL